MSKKYILHGDESFHLAPFEFPWAYSMTKKSLDNHWHPQEVPMGNDKAVYEQQLNRSEIHLFKHVFASLTTSDLAVASNLTERFYGLVKAAEIRLYLSRQIAEEGLHSLSYQHVIESLNMDQDEVYHLYQRVPQIKAWFEFAESCMEFHGGDDDILLPLIFSYAIWEGTFFPTAFAAIFSLQRRNLMTGTGEQLQYIFRDESMHIAFGVKLLNSVFEELGRKPLQSEVHALFYEAMKYIDDWADYCIPDVLGYNAGLHKTHSRFLADKRLRSLGYGPLFNAENVLPWLDEQVAIRKEKNFFESRVTEYRSAGGLTFEESSMDDIVNWRH